VDPTPFFDFARERHNIYLRRQAGLPRSEWTSDPILAHYRFTNVYRELDATTIHHRQLVRQQIVHPPELLLAIVVYRWFNRRETADAIFSRADLMPSAFDEFFRTGETAYMKEQILAHCGDGPYVTGAYIVRTYEGSSKLDGVLWAIRTFHQSARPHRGESTSWLDMGMLLDTHEHSMEEVWDWLVKFPLIGPFGAYEIVCDLRYTPLLDDAPDRLAWANPGPGAMRGLNRLHGREVSRHAPRAQYIAEMRELLACAHGNWWPKTPAADWPAWEMREVEHTLCEFDKYRRVQLDEGRPRGVYR